MSERRLKLGHRKEYKRKSKHTVIQATILDTLLK